MKSIHRGNIGGNCKLRGKLSATLSCRCCDIYNFKPSERWKEAKKEIDKFVATDSLERGPDGKAADC